MKSLSVAPAALAQPAPGELALSGCWTVLGTGALDRQFEALTLPAQARIVVDGAGVERLDTVGVWLLQ